MQNRKSYKSDILLFLIVSISVFIYSTIKQNELKFELLRSPFLYLSIISVLLAIVCIISLFRRDITLKSNIDIRSSFIIILYIISVNYLNFYFSTAIFLFSMILMINRKGYASAIFSIIFTLSFVYLIFEKVFNIGF